jgi:hypothetical protein
MNKFSELIGKKVDKLFLVVWMPCGEENEANIDISFGFVFQDTPNQLCVISVDKDDLWSQNVFYQSLPQNLYTWKDYYDRIKMCMNMEDENCIVGKEYYDVSNCELFEKIVNSQIIEIELISVIDNPEPFGVKIIFFNDYIISTPISDGNTVETSKFNQNNNLGIFEKIGKIVYTKCLS